MTEAWEGLFTANRNSCNRAAAHEVTKYLLGKGHSHIGMIAGRGGPQTVRVKGYEAALAERALPARIVVDDHFTEEGGFRAAMTMLDHDQRPTAIFAANDLMAIGAMQAVRERGLQFPMMSQSWVSTTYGPLIRIASIIDRCSVPGRYWDGSRKDHMQRLSGTKTGGGTVMEMPFRLIERSSA